MRRNQNFRQAWLAVLSVAFLAFTSVAHAHAILLVAKPAIGESVNGPDIKVSLKFNSRVDSKRSKITLVLPGGELRQLNIDVQSSADTLSSQARGLKNGPHVLQWQVLAVDGHISRGEVPFRIE
jgi:methionine-rich copper-binding protein CopC